MRCGRDVGVGYRGKGLDYEADENLVGALCCCCCCCWGLVGVPDDLWWPLGGILTRKPSMQNVMQAGHYISGNFSEPPAAQLGSS